jgi:hypothetical protein
MQQNREHGSLLKSGDYGDVKCVDDTILQQKTATEAADRSASQLKRSS